jgi:hypothetical protein
MAMAQNRHLLVSGPCLALGLALVLMGCSAHPLPENVSRASTYDIVERVRCEVLEGLNSFPPEEQEKAESIIANVTIGYDFDFKITETNSAASGRLEFQRRAFKGDNTGFFLDLSASSEARRRNVRTFRVVDRLTELKKERQAKCSRVATAVNGLHPITGATGMAEVVRTYIKLEMLSHLGEFDLGKHKGAVFSDELLYTTNLRAGVSPQLELRTLAGEFRLSHTSFAGAAARDDVHSITIVLTRGGGNENARKLAKLFAGPVMRAADAKSPLQGETVIQPYRTLRRLIASQAPGPEARVIYELQRRRNVREDARVVSRILDGAD